MDSEKIAVVVGTRPGIIKMSPKLNAKGYNYAFLADPQRCIGCRLCAITCPDVAIEVYAEGTQYEFFSY